jgi:hypothetical protein
MYAPRLRKCGAFVPPGARLRLQASIAAGPRLYADVASRTHVHSNGNGSKITVVDNMKSTNKRALARSNQCPSFSQKLFKSMPQFPTKPREHGNIYVTVD